jgi:predicted transcriptional regulator
VSPAHQQLVAAWKRSSLTARGVADLAKVHENTVLRVFSGEDCHYSTMQAIARALGFTSLTL